MKNYTEMTDFEINCAVARALGMAHAFFFSKSEDDFCEGIEPNERGPIWQSNEYKVGGFRVSNGNCFNPCNSWADAGPIIAEHGISIVLPEGETEWCASYKVSWVDGVECQIDGEWHDNPLRAAMIVFLMMQQGK